MVRRNETGYPDYPTCVRARLSGGRLLGTDGSMWLYRAVPLNPVVDAASPSEAIAAAEPLLAAFDELAALANVGVARRSTARSGYRQIHLLLMNVPTQFTPPKDHPNSTYLATAFADQAVDRRVLLIGVRIIDKVTSGGMKAAVESIKETLLQGSVPIEDFAADHRIVSAALGRAGMVDASDEDLMLASSWWTHGDRPDVVMMEHASHLHVFNNADDAAPAAEAGRDCSTREWDILDQFALSFVSVQDFDFDIVPADSYQAWWVPRLMNSGAVVVSIRGGIEPAKVTRAELRRRKKQFLEDIREAAENGKMERAEQTENLHRLDQAEQAYSDDGAPPVLTDASVVVAIDGRIGDIGEVSHATGLKLRTMDHRQLAAMSETWPCSNIRANPHLHDLPAQTVACSGLPSISRVGDTDGAMIGLTEVDRQPAFLSPDAAAKADSLPMGLVAGATGSGKTMLMLWAADQFSRAGHPTVILDPKLGSDHSATVLASGGQVASLDDLTKADGVFDPLRFAISPEAGIDMAGSMLMSVNPWGTQSHDFETPLMSALRYGVDNGATCIGEALRMAERAGKAPAEMVKGAFDLAEASPMFRACMGINPSTAGLRVADGITLIKVGNAHLELPEPGTARVDLTPQQRVAMALVRMMVFGSASALTGRQGVLLADEAWTILSAGKSEVERLGRLARSQGVLPILFTQRVSDAVNAGLTGYISRGLILPIQDKGEAQAACELFELDPTPERMSRITARATIGGTDGDGGAPNWNSMRHLRDPKTGRTIRGSVAIYADLHGRAVPVEVIIPSWFLERASTNPDDIRRRAAAIEAETAAAAVPALPATSAVVPTGVGEGPGLADALGPDLSAADGPVPIDDFDLG